MALTSSERKSLIASVDSAEITLSNGEKPEASVARDIRYNARQFLKKELANVSTKAEADELVRGTFALMRSADASDSAFSREKLRLRHDVQTASRDLRGSLPAATSASESDESSESDDILSIGRIDLGRDYSGHSIQDQVPNFLPKKRPSLTIDEFKGAQTSVLGEGVIMRSRATGMRIHNTLARGTTVTLTGEIVYMRGVDSAGKSHVLPYAVVAGGHALIAAKFLDNIETESYRAAAAAQAPARARAQARARAADSQTAATATETAPSTGTLPRPGAKVGEPTPDAPASASTVPSPVLPNPGTPQSSPGTVSSAPTRPVDIGAESATAASKMRALARRWSYPTEAAHTDALLGLTPVDIAEAWGLDEVRAVLTPTGARITRDEQNYQMVTFADLNKSKFELLAPPALRAKVADMELILKAAIASDGDQSVYSDAYEAFRTAVGRYSSDNKNDAEIEAVMASAATGIDGKFGFWSGQIGSRVMPGVRRDVKDILAQTDSTARRRMAYEWARYVSHDTLKETILNDKFETLTKTAGAEITQADLVTVQRLLGDFGSTAVGNFERGIRDPMSAAENDRAIFQKFHTILTARLSAEADRSAAISRFVDNLRRKVVDGGRDGGSEAKKYLDNHAQANHEAIRTKIREEKGVDINGVLANGAINENEQKALALYHKTTRDVESHVTAIFAITAVKTGIFDAAADAAVRTDTLKNDPDTALYGDIMGKGGILDWSDSTYAIGANTLAFVLPEVIGMAVGMGVGYATMRSLSWWYSAVRGVEYARMASGVGRFGRYGAEAARLGRLATEGIVYGGSMHMGGLVVPNIMHGRDWNEGFDRNELFFNMGLGAIYPALHALNLWSKAIAMSPFGKIITGQKAWHKVTSFGVNSLFDTLVVAGGLEVAVHLGAGDWAEKDMWEILTMIPLMRVGMNLSAGGRHDFMFKKGPNGEITTSVLNTKYAPAMDELSRSFKALAKAPEGAVMDFPGSTVTKLANGEYRVSVGGVETLVKPSIVPGKQARDILAIVKKGAPELTPEQINAMARARAELELSDVMADSVTLTGGQRVTLDNPTAAVADRRYTMTDASGKVVAQGVERSKLTGFVTEINDAGVVHTTTGLVAQLRAGAHEVVEDAAGIRVVVKNPGEAVVDSRLCEIYHNNIKIADDISIAQAEIRLNTVFAAVDDANLARIAKELQGTPAKLTNTDGALSATIYDGPRGSLYQIKQGSVTIDDLNAVEAKLLVGNGIAKKNDLEIKALLEASSVPTKGVPVGGDMFLTYDPKIAIDARVYKLVYRSPTPGYAPVVILKKTHAETTAILKEGIDKVSTTADDFIDVMSKKATAGLDHSSHGDITLRASATAGKYDVEIAPPAGSPAGTAPQKYAEGISLDDARTILSGGSVARATPAPDFLLPLRGALAPHEVSFGNLKVVTENPGVALADRTYRIECDGMTFGTGMKIDDMERYINNANAIKNLDKGLDVLDPPAGTGGGPRTAKVSGHEVTRNADGTYSMGTRQSMTRDDVISELALRDRASRTLYGQDSPLFKAYTDRIVGKLEIGKEFKMKFGTNEVTIKRLGADKFEVSGGNAGTRGNPELIDSHINTQSKLREAISARAGIEANGYKYLEENAPVILRKALDNLKGSGRAEVHGAIDGSVSNPKAKSALKSLWDKHGPLADAWPNLKADMKTNPKLGWLYWLISGGRETTGLRNAIWQGTVVNLGTGALISTAVNGIEVGIREWSLDEWLKAAAQWPSLGEIYLSGAAWGVSKGLGAALAATLVNIDWSRYTGNKPEEIIDYIAEQTKTS